MNPLLTIVVDTFSNTLGERIITVGFSEQTPLGNGGFVYPLSPSEAKILVEKLQEALAVKK